MTLKEPDHYRTNLSEKWERKNILDDAQGVATACHALSTPHLTASPVLGEGLYPPHLRYGHTRPHRKHAGESDDLPSSHLTPILCLMNNPNKCQTARVQPNWKDYLECILPNKPCHGQVLQAREPCSDVVESKGAKCLPTAWIHPTARSM